MRHQGSHSFPTFPAQNAVQHPARRLLTMRFVKTGSYQSAATASARLVLSALQLCGKVCAHARLAGIRQQLYVVFVRTNRVFNESTVAF
jgi:hypothetical protein